MAPLAPEGLIDHYLTGVVYPANARRCSAAAAAAGTDDDHHGDLLGAGRVRHGRWYAG
jgi:hypothetical protein